MTPEELELVQAYKFVEKTGNRLGVLKEELHPIAESLVKQGVLTPLGLQGLYALNE